MDSTTRWNGQSTMAEQQTDFFNLASLLRSPSLFLDFILEPPAISSVSDAEQFLIRNRDIPSFPKSWIIFRSLGLFDQSTREELAKGFQPWNAPDETSLWVFNDLAHKECFCPYFECFLHMGSSQKVQGCTVLLSIRYSKCPYTEMVFSPYL